MKKFASMAAVVVTAGSLLATSAYAANNAFGIDEINWSAEDWASIAMTNDDTVETGAVIRTEANADSKAAGYLYRGGAAKVVEKGEEWSLIESGRVTGYVKNEFLTFGEEAKGLAAHYGEQGVVANWNDVTMFSGRDGASAAAATVDDGAVLGMVQDDGHWITVQQGKDSAGYVSEEDVTRVLLVDTAVPAEGEDVADVVVTMTAEEVAALNGAPAEEASASEEEASYEETSYDASAQDEYYEYDTSDGYDSYDGSGDAYAAAPEEDYTNPQIVSDDPTIQALYEAFMAAQNAAMNCTSAEDAAQKAAAATAAWNAYLAACNGTSVSAASDTGSASADTSADTDADSDEDEYEDDSVYSADEDTYDEDDDESLDAADDEWIDVDDEDDDSSDDSSSSDAVAAASSNSSGLYGGASDLDLLAAIIWCEAGNQPYDGMVAVGQVVMNRVKSGSFPNTIAEVLNSPGQFTPSSSGALQAAINAGVNATCYAAAADALNGASPVPGTPLYFNTHSGSYKLGAHYFS